MQCYSNLYLNSKIDQGLSIFTILTVRDQIEIIDFQRFEPDLIDLNFEWCANFGVLHSRPETVRGHLLFLWMSKSSFA